mmetsp:Transcript_37378/g.103941  ORF Transcript_37378/g.103941 Transcript_37378/m.103941 type:complete len:133 (-) Transcript_37378:74-472(-)
MPRIQVFVVSAMDLPNTDVLSKTDAYCRVTMGGTEVLKTKVVNNNLNPVWDAKKFVQWDGINDLIFSIWDSDTFTSDDWVGQYILTKSHVQNGYKGTVPLNMGKRYRRSKNATLTIKVAPPDSACCGGCSVM